MGHWAYVLAGLRGDSARRVDEEKGKEKRRDVRWVDVRLAPRIVSGGLDRDDGGFEVLLDMTAQPWGVWRLHTLHVAASSIDVGSRNGGCGPVCSVG